MLDPWLRPATPLYTVVDPERVAHFRRGPECMRSSCHRTAEHRIRAWLVCTPCAYAVADALDYRRLERISA